MQSIRTIRALLAEHGLHPNHRLGQNFLHDANQVRRLVAASGVGAGDLVLEVGPGTGALTEALVEGGVDVVACELDGGLADLIEARLGDRIVLVRGDCLESGRHLSSAIRAALAGREFTLVANLPYQAASPLMATLSLDEPTCLGQFVTIQREVADRLVAGPGSKAYGPLGIVIQAVSTVERIAIVPPSCFWPEPKVTSAMVAIRPRPHDIDQPAAFGRFVSMVFGKRRKQLGTILGRDAAWPEGIAPEQRPETLTVAQLVALWRATREGEGG